MADPLECSLLGLLYDAGTDSCVSADPPVVCFPPYVQDFTNNTCVLGSDFSQTPGTPPETIVEQPPVTVDIQNNVNVADQTLSAVANAVQNAISGGANAAAGVAKQASDDIVNAIKTTTDAITQGAKDAFSTIGGWIKDIASAIGSSVGSLVGFITNNLGTVISTIGSDLKSAFTTVETAVNSISSFIQNINDNFIQPVVGTIQSDIRTVGALTTAIETDLHNGLSGILQIPGQISDALTSIDASLQRTINQLPDALKTGVADVLIGPGGGSLGGPLTAIGGSFTNVTGDDARKTTFSDHVKLPEPNVTQAGAATIDAIWKEIHDTVINLFSGGTRTLDVLKTALAGVPFLLGDIVEIPAAAAVVAGTVVAGTLPLLEFLRGDIASKSGLAKLAPGDALTAYLRQFIDIDNVKVELAFNGWDEQRIQTMLDLQIQLLDVSSIVEMFFRGIATEADTRANLLQHGFVPDDQDAILLAAYRLVDVQQGATAWRYGFIDDSQLTAILKQNRYTDNEITLWFLTALRPISNVMLMARKRLAGLYQGQILQSTAWLTAPDDVVQAAKRDGLSPDYASAEWSEQINIPPLEAWLSLYFRGIRTRQELSFAMDYYNVPVELQDDIIQANHALIPFRTIPTMLANGIIDEPYARAQLAAHGFDLVAQNALLKYASIHKTAAAATVATDLKSIAIGAAKTAWADGAITDDQYTAILKAHGYDDNAVALTLKVERLEIAAKNRKEAAQNVVDEALAGLIDPATVQPTLAQQGLSQAEQAHYLKQLKRGTTAAAKTPSEPELKKMWKAGLIQESDYRAALQTLGYAPKWVDAFAALDTPATTSNAAGAPVNTTG